jgi:hypothetical protein
MEKKEKASAEDIRSKRTENEESDFNYNLIVDFFFIIILRLFYFTTNTGQCA